MPIKEEVEMVGVSARLCEFINFRQAAFLVTAIQN
jgi:hypothetical protein